jgi:large subunit ribosomal protein L10
MNRTEKAAAVEALSTDLAKTKNAFLFSFVGLKVGEVTELRRQVRGTKSKYVVVKNTLAKRAAKGSAIEPVSGELTGPTAIAYNADNAVALAKVLTAFAKANPALVFKAAVVDGQPIVAAQIQTIADLPSREELVSRLLFLMESPLRRLVTVLNGPVRGLAGTLHQVAEQMGKSQ